MQQRVAILGEHDCRLVHTPQKTGERGDLRLAPRGSFRRAPESAEEPPLVRGTAETEKRRPCRRFVGPRVLAVPIAEGKNNLACSRFFFGRHA